MNGWKLSSSPRDLQSRRHRQPRRYRRRAAPCQRCRLSRARPQRAQRRFPVFAAQPAARTLRRGPRHRADLQPARRAALTQRVSRQRPRDAEAGVVGIVEVPARGVGPAARGGAQELRARCSRSRRAARACVQSPCFQARAVAGRADIALVPAIVGPLPDIAQHVVEAERVGLEAADRRRSPARPSGCRSRCNWRCRCRCASPHQRAVVVPARAAYSHSASLGRR